MTVYLDMDGVIADFFGGVEKLYGVDHWKSIQHRDGIFVEIRNTAFFNSLETFYDDQGNCLSSKIVQFTRIISDDDWGICSSPLRGDVNNSAYWKRRWLEDRNWVPSDLENMIFTSSKHKYAMNKLTRKPNILVDDKPSNIEKWTAAGGIGILFQCNQDDIEEYLFPQLENALEIYN